MIRVVDPYQVLGLDPSATDQEIRRVYVVLARRHHPDGFTGANASERAEADRRMREINEAWQLLGDRERRAAFDRDRGREGNDPVDGATGRSSVVDHSPKREWQPFEPDDNDEPDPRDLIDDTPYGDGSRPPRGLPLLVTVFFLGAIAAFSIGLVTRLAGVLVLGIVLFGLAGLSLVAAPILALSKSWSNERDADAGRS